MNRSISCTTGVFNSEYTLTCHKDGSVTVRHPYIKWVNNSGSLAYCKNRVYGERAELVKDFFTRDELVSVDGSTVIDELL